MAQIGGFTILASEKWLHGNYTIRLSGAHISFVFDFDVAQIGGFIILASYKWLDGNHTLRFSGVHI